MAKDKPAETEEERKEREMVEEIATNIAKLSRQVSALLSGRVKRKTIILLLSASMVLVIASFPVLTAIENMESDHLQ